MCLAQGYNAVPLIRLEPATKLKEDQTLLWTCVAGAHPQYLNNHYAKFDWKGIKKI